MAACSGCCCINHLTCWLCSVNHNCRSHFPHHMEAALWFYSTSLFPCIFGIQRLNLNRCLSACLDCVEMYHRITVLQEVTIIKDLSWKAVRMGSYHYSKLYMYQLHKSNRDDYNWPVLNPSPAPSPHGTSLSCFKNSL